MGLKSASFVSMFNNGNKNRLFLWLGLVGAKFKNITSLTFKNSTDSIERGKSYSTHLARFEFRKVYNRNIYAL